MKGILLKQRNKEGVISFSDQWKLLAKGNYPERIMSTFAFYNFDEETIERMTLNDDEIKNLKLYDEGGEEVDISGFNRFFSDMGKGGLTVIEVETENIKKGKMTIETVVALRITGTLAIED